MARSHTSPQLNVVWEEVRGCCMLKVLASHIQFLCTSTAVCLVKRMWKSEGALDWESLCFWLPSSQFKKFLICNDYRWWQLAKASPWATGLSSWRTRNEGVGKGNNVCSVADPEPGPGAFLTPESGIRDGQKIKIRIRRSYFRKNFWVRILKFFDGDPGPGSENLFDPGSGMEKIRIRFLYF